MTKLHSNKVNFHQNEVILDLTRYDLVAVVIHCGSGPNRFVSVKSELRNYTDAKKWAFGRDFVFSEAITSRS